MFASSEKADELLEIIKEMVLEINKIFSAKIAQMNKKTVSILLKNHLEYLEYLFIFAILGFLIILYPLFFDYNATSLYIIGIGIWICVLIFSIVVLLKYFYNIQSYSKIKSKEMAKNEIEDYLYKNKDIYKKY